MRTKRFYIFAGSNDEWGAMKDLKDYEIKFSGLKLGKHSFDFQLDDKFFEHFGFSEFANSRLDVQVDFLKKENGLEIKAEMTGLVEVPCDMSGDPFDLPLEGSLMLLVKYGEEFDDTNDEILVIPHGEHQVNIAQYLYETAVLALPLKRVSPEMQKQEEGTEKRNELEDDSDGEDEIDPRWNKLKDLLN